MYDDDGDGEGGTHAYKTCKYVSKNISKAQIIKYVAPR